MSSSAFTFLLLFSAWIINKSPFNLSDLARFQAHPESSLVSLTSHSSLLRFPCFASSTGLPTVKKHTFSISGSERDVQTPVFFFSISFHSVRTPRHGRLFLRRRPGHSTELLLARWGTNSVSTLCFRGANISQTPILFLFSLSLCLLVTHRKKAWWIFCADWGVGGDWINVLSLKA